MFHAVSQRSSVELGRQRRAGEELGGRRHRGQRRGRRRRRAGEGGRGAAGDAHERELERDEPPEAAGCRILAHAGR